MGWAWKTALRDARGSRAKAVLYALSMALGMAALVAMGSFGADLDQAVNEQAKSLVGSDLTVFSRKPFGTEAENFFSQVPGESSELIGFSSMAYFPKVEEAALARIRGIQGGFPFYGEVETEPADALARCREGRKALVARTLMDRMEAQVGDMVRVGQLEFEIAGILNKFPGDTAVSTVMGPRIFVAMDHIEETGLVQQGSRVFYLKAFRLPKTVDPDALVAPQEAMFKEHRLGYETAKTQRESLGEAMGNLTNFLNLIACLALLLGGLGVAGAVHYHLKQKVRQVAVLRCMGATVSQVVAVFLIQVSLMAALAMVIGVALGLGFQFLLPGIVGEFLPFEFTPRIHPVAIAVACLWGWSMCLLLALAPLISIRRVSPLLSFRPDLAPRHRDGYQVLAYGLVVLIWWLFAVNQTGSWYQGSIFIGALLASIAVLYLIARTLGWAARKFTSPRWPFPLRYGLANLFRPQNQTSVFLIILGMGVFLITVLSGARSMLLGQFQGALGEDRPNFIAFDIQPDQVDGVLETVRSQGLPVDKAIPIVPMRIQSIKGLPVAELLDQGIPDWALRFEYRASYRAILSDTEELVSGEWKGKVERDVDPVPVSVERDIAETLTLEMGDAFTMDVLGIPLELQVASLRKVNWQSMQPNFYMLFPEGVLEGAPQMYILATQTEGAAQVARLQKELVIRYPNVSCVDLTEVVENIDLILTKVVSVVRFLAALCVITGFVLLASAIWNSRYERLGEHALLRTLGASRKQMAQMTLVETFLLGVFAALTGLMLAAGASWALGRFLFEVPPFPDPLALLPPVLALPFLTLTLGYFGLRGIWQVAPRTVLRHEDV